jgi:hypothetical protein
MGSLAWGGGGSGWIMGTGGAPGRGVGGVRPHAHLGSGGGRSWGEGVAGVGARRGPAAAAAAGGVAGEWGARLANKRKLWLTGELGEALGVSAGDERLGKLELVQAATMAGGTTMTARTRRARPLNRGGSACGDDGVTVKMLLWYWRPRPACGWIGGPWRAPCGVRCGQQRRVARAEFKAPRGAGAWWRRAAWAACGRGRRGGALADTHFRLSDFEPVFLQKYCTVVHKVMNRKVVDLTIPYNFHKGFRV